MPSAQASSTSTGNLSAFGTVWRKPRRLMMGVGGRCLRRWAYLYFSIQIASLITYLTQLFKRKKDDAASVVSRATSAGGSQFKVVASKRESLLPNSGHPTGWVNRADDAKAAETSNEWRSDAYVLLMFPCEMVFLTGAIGVDLISNPAPLPL